MTHFLSHAYISFSLQKDLELQALLKQLGESAQEVFGGDICDRNRPGRRSDFVVRVREGESRLINLKVSFCKNRPWEIFQNGGAHRRWAQGQPVA